MLSIVELSAAGELRATLTRTSKARLSDTARDRFGGIERTEVITALQSLAGDGPSGV